MNKGQRKSLKRRIKVSETLTFILSKKASDYVLEKPRDQKRINFAKKAEKNASRGE